MDKIGILFHPKIAFAFPLAKELEREAKSFGVSDVWLSSAWDELSIIAEAPGSGMVITLGGDGTILRAARAVSPLGVPILAVNLGKLGFLTELSPDTACRELPQFLAGRAWIEERIMLQVQLKTTARSLTARSVDGQATLDPDCSFHALNEVAVARGERLRVINVDVRIDGEKGPSYVGDGMIVSTPTGSTGYSLAAGGPVLHPELGNFIVTPIAPHLKIGRAIVIPASSTVELDIRTNDGAILSVDGQIDVSLGTGDGAKVVRSPYVTRLLRARSRTYFYGALAARLK
ncbi:MAG: NAD(+)/NADH kinase [Dehalococcoidia bacterium]|nr:NAD(+)/NADH kinase [Dehalococcoidia bacterium]